MLRVGPNPYGLCCTLGLQGKSEHPKDIYWFIELALSMKGRCIEFHFQHLAALDGDALLEIQRQLELASIEPIISGPWPLARLPEAFPIAKLLGVRVVRTHLSPVLCGARAAEGEGWSALGREIRTNLKTLGPMFSDQNLILSIENHQDFGSEELMEFCEIGGPSVGVTLDTGNPLGVGEEPLAFARTVAPKVKHVHLKDYWAQPTPEGYRLIRCPIGDGAVPLQEMAVILEEYHQDLTAALEPGALDSRHVKLLTSEWWHGYPIRSEDEKTACLDASRRNALPENEDWRTPWERGESAKSVCQFEMDQMMKSIQNMKSYGWLPA